MFSIMGTFMKVNPLYLRIFSYNSNTFNKEVLFIMGKDRQERKLRESRRVESDAINHYNIQVQLDLIHQEQARKQNQHAKDGFDIVRNRLLHNQFNVFYLY